MGTRNVNLSVGLDHFIDEQVESGVYQNASEVVRAGLRLLKEQRDEHEAKLARLREAINEGLESLDRGEGIEVTDIDAWMLELQNESAE
ncbi:antitoxin ParD1/3/4 [Caulobacter ginsengisoli]|uniref:Antitoxin ParD1/3/4 n=1 Tax=Caulobacter ginsengisoli TaxID=400775 RepID=A0ABU0ITB9_9CAUL|nr:type II toxin-antitoxin system ParD family antitoxin [Caulobacter ginsengisoli]MDQ0464611.1 antitoxin ParD1/3/4 [Caulobacter ginsengisoli]